MSPREVELALIRQRLQFDGARQRETLARCFGELAPLFTAADRLADGVGWLRRHPELAVGAFTLLVASRRMRAFLWRWSKRGFLLWQLWRRYRASFAFPPRLR